MMNGFFSVNGGSSMNGRGGRHPSLEQLPRPPQGNRSYPQLPTDSRAYQEDPEVEEDEDGPLDLLIGFISAMATLVCIFGVLTILTVLYVTVRPFSRPLYRRLAAQLGEGSFLDAMAILLPNTRLCLTGDSDVPSPVGTSVLVSNHLIDGDWWAALMLGRCVGLRGSVKFFLRKELVEANSSFRCNSERSVGSAVAARAELNGGQQVAASKSVTFQRSTSGNGSSRAYVSPQLSLAGKLLHLLLEFPVLSGENNKDYVSDRADLFILLRSFAEQNGTAAPVHLMLYPEVWSLHDHSLLDRKSILAKSNEFAKREGRPQLKYLLLPRTTGFNASLESLRASSPVVYDVTMVSLTVLLCLLLTQSYLLEFTFVLCRRMLVTTDQFLPRVISHCPQYGEFYESNIPLKFIFA